MTRRFDAAAAGRLGIFVLVFLVAAGLTACDGDSGPGTPGVEFLDAGTVPDDVGGLTPRPDVVTPDVPLYDGGGAPDVDQDAGSCFVNPYREYPVVLGALSSYTRGESYPSIRQWTDRARSEGYSGLVLADQQRRDANAAVHHKFSDSNPDAPIQLVMEFDRAFDEFQHSGTDSAATVITDAQDPDILFEQGVRLRGAPGGWAYASYDHSGGFDYDLQDLTFKVRVKVSRKVAPARVLLRATYGPKGNKRETTWVLAHAGDPGEGIVAGQNAGADKFYSYELPMKADIISEVGNTGELIWREGTLDTIELRVEGDADAVFDTARLQVDAWYDVLRQEIERYSDGQLLFVPGVEHRFEAGRGQYNCVGAPAFPESDEDWETGMLTDFANQGCFTIADRIVASGASMGVALLAEVDGFEIWHPNFNRDGNIDLAYWDELLLAYGRKTALGSAFPRTPEEVAEDTIHNRVLAEAHTEESFVAAMRAGRVYMTDSLNVSAEFWAEGPDCGRVEMGASAPSAQALHVQVNCPGGVASARLVRRALPNGDPAEQQLNLGPDETVIDVSEWPQSFVRLEAECAGGARIYTNPIWL